MHTLHPRLPKHRPLASAHRAGNSISEALRAVTIGCDLIETDVWLRGNQLDLRHMHRMGRLPVLWERWRIRLDLERLKLHMLLRVINDQSLLFLDLKGEARGLGPTIVRQLRDHSPGYHVALCGRNYAQLDVVLGEPEVTVFYSVGEEREFADAWPRLERMEWPAISIHRKLVTPMVMDRLNTMGATIICWDVETFAQARELYSMGVDGFTSDNLELLGQIAKHGPAALFGMDTV